MRPVANPTSPVPHSFFFPHYYQSEMQKLSRTVFKLKSPQRNKGCKSENTTFNSVLWPQAPQTLLLGRPCGWSPGHTSASFKATQISDWLYLGYKIIGRNFASSVLCRFFAMMYFQGTTAEIAVFRIWGEDLSSCLCHHLMMTLRPRPCRPWPPSAGRRQAGCAALAPPTRLNLLQSPLPAPTALLSQHPRILTAAPAPSCHQKPPVPPLQSGSPSAAWGSKETRTAPGWWTRTPRNSWQEGVK